MSPFLTIRAFGPLLVTVEGESLPRLSRQAGYRLLALLALRTGPQPRRLLAGLLWPDSEDAQALFYLRRTLTEVKRALGSASDVLFATPRTLELRATEVTCDLWEFRAALARKEWTAAVAAYAGPLLEGWVDDWLLSERETCERRFLEALEIAATSARGPREAVELLGQVVAREPGRESAWRSLMEALAGLGEAGELTQAYRKLRLYLRDVARVDPSRETKDCYERLRDEVRRRATVHRLIESPSPVAKLPEPEFEYLRLPSPRTPLIGRVVEIRRVRELVSSERLVTLAGIGGVGKTRLAIAVLHALADESRDGVWWVDLSATTDAGQVRARIATALGAPEEVLDAWLRDRDGVLALDNCEQILSGVATVADSLLESAPKLRILATSREPLGVPGEVVWRVPTLSASESVALFLERARRVRPDWVVTPESAATVAGICRRLDDIALAIELATALLSTLTVDEIADRLHERFELLRFGARTLQARQQTLEAAMDWSWELLSEREKALLAGLSAFAGGWSLDAAEAICGPRVLTPLRALVEKSLVVHEPNVGRYRLLETVREYAQSQLAPETSASLAEKHARFFCELANRAADRTTGIPPAEALAALDADHDNLRSSFDWGLGHDPEVSLSLAASLWPFWRERGFRVEGRKRVADALKAADPSLSAAPSARLGLGFFCYDFDDYDGALSLLEEAFASAVARDDGWCAAEARRGRGLVLWNRGNTDDARASYDDALARFTALGRKDGMAATLAALAHLAWNLGDLDTATRRNVESQRFFRELGDEAGIAETSSHLGLIARSAEDFSAARRHFTEALRIRERLGLSAGVATIQHHLGVIAFLEGSLDDAATMLTRSAAAWSDLGDRGWQANSLNYLGLVHRDRGDLDGAEKTLLHALELRQGLSAQRAVAGLLFALGGVSLRRERYELARERFAQSAEKRAALKLEEGTVEAVCGLGAALAALGRTKEAEGALALAERLVAGNLPEGARPFAEQVRRLSESDSASASPRYESVAELLVALR